MPREGEDATHPQACARRHRGHPPGVLGWASRPAQAAVHLDDHLDVRAAEQPARRWPPRRPSRRRWRRWPARRGRGAVPRPGRRATGDRRRRRRHSRGGRRPRPHPGSRPSGRPRPRRAGGGRSRRSCASWRAAAAPPSRRSPARRRPGRCGASGPGRRGGTATSARASAQARATEVSAFHRSQRHGAVRGADVGDDPEAVPLVERDVARVRRRAPASNAGGVTARVIAALLSALALQSCAADPDPAAPGATCGRARPGHRPQRDPAAGGHAVARARGARTAVERRPATSRGAPDPVDRRPGGGRAVRRVDRRRARGPTSRTAAWPRARTARAAASAPEGSATTRSPRTGPRPHGPSSSSRTYDAASGSWWTCVAPGERSHVMSTW